MTKRHALRHALAGICGPFLLGSSCLPTPPGSGNFNNTTDPTNGGASYVGSAACAACHPDVAAHHRIHGHANVLQAIHGAPPQYPADGIHAGVPNPPPGYTWNDIAYLVGGYSRKAVFIDNDGFQITTGYNGVDAQWNLANPATARQPGFAAYLPDEPARQPYDHACFVCHTTGATPSSAEAPLFQDNRPGMAGTFVEAGVQCEACHGPGSNHVPNPSARNIYVNSSATDCAQCHDRTGDARILAADGFIRNYQQYAELRASGGHANFDCTYCHDPHASTQYDRARGIRNECTACHSDMNLALHEGLTFTRGDYSEPLTCQSCHMPYASLSAARAVPTGQGVPARMGDIRTHIFRINASNTNFSGMFTPDGTEVLRDAQGRAAVTVDFVCLRCHDGTGNAFTLSIGSASEIADVMHQFDN